MLPTICPILSPLSWSCKSLQGSILLVAHTLTFVQLGVWGQDLYSFVFPLHYNFNNLSFKTMERVLYSCTVLVHVSDDFYIPLFISRSNWEKKKKRWRPNQLYSLLCFAWKSPGAFWRRKSLKTLIAPFIIICLFSFSTSYWNNWGNLYVLRKKKKIFFIGIVKFNNKELYILFANDIQISTLSIVISLSYFSFSKSLLF